jgi:uncharacterized membrane protein YkoI
MKTIVVATAVLGLMATAVTAQERLAVSAVLAAVEAQGFTVIELDDEGGWLEVEATNAQGRRVELLVDPSTGKIIREGFDD